METDYNNADFRRPDSGDPVTALERVDSSRVPRKAFAAATVAVAPREAGAAEAARALRGTSRKVSRSRPAMSMADIENRGKFMSGTMRRRKVADNSTVWRPGTPAGVTIP